MKSALSPDFVHISLFDVVRLEDIILAPDDLFLVDGIIQREDGGQLFDFQTNVAPRFFEQVFVRVREQDDWLFRVVDELAGKIWLIQQDERDAVFARNVFRRHDDEFVPGDVALKGDVLDAATRARAADGRAVEHLREVQIVYIARLPRDFIAAFFARHGLPDELHLFFSVVQPTNERAIACGDRVKRGSLLFVILDNERLEDIASEQRLLVENFSVSVPETTNISRLRTLYVTVRFS